MINYPKVSLQPGQTGDNVKQLQDYLVSIGYMNQSQVNTGYGIYGPKTKSAVAKLQQDLGVDTAGNSGFWGPRTLAKIQESTGNQQATETPQIPQGPQAPQQQIADIQRQIQELQNIQQESQQLGYQGSQEFKYDTGGALIPPSNYDTGDATLNATLDALAGVIDKTTKAGQIVNPYVEITPEKIADFTAQAQKEIDPYYSTQLKIARESLYKDIGYSQEQILQKESDLERTYGKNLITLSSNMAETGMLYSGERQQQERDLAGEAQRAIDANRRTLEFGAGQKAGEYAQLWGGQDLTSPTISETPRVLAGEGAFNKPTNTRDIYTLNPDIYQSLTGSNQYQQEADRRRRIAELKGLYTTDETARQLNLLNQ